MSDETSISSIRLNRTLKNSPLNRPVSFPLVAWCDLTKLYPHRGILLEDGQILITKSIKGCKFDVSTNRINFGMNPFNRSCSPFGNIVVHLSDEDK